MKILRLYGTASSGTFSYQGVKTLYDDNITKYNDTQTAMDVIQWITSITDTSSWLWDNGEQMLWDDGSPILLD